MSSKISALVVRSGSTYCALHTSHVIETFRPLPTEPAGEAPDFVLGLAVIRGAPVPVVDLARLLVEKSEGPNTRFVSLRVGNRQVALAVEEVLDVREVETSAFNALPPLLGHGSGEAVEAVGSLDAHLLLLLKEARLVSEDLLANRMNGSKAAA